MAYQRRQNLSLKKVCNRLMKENYKQMQGMSLLEVIVNTVKL